MGELTMGVSWLAVGVGTFLSFMLGSLWYSKLMFGEKWTAGVGVEMNTGSTQPIPALILQFIGTFLLAWLIGITAANETLLLPVLIAVTICVLLIAACLFAAHSRYAALVEGGFVLVMVAIMIVCHTFL